MDDVTRSLTCPYCEGVNSSPENATIVTCEWCGMRILAKDAGEMAEQASQRVRDKTQHAADLTLDAVQFAVDLAQSDASAADKEAALQAARQAMEALRVAQEAQRSVEQAHAEMAAALESARIASEQQAQFEQTERERVERENKARIDQMARERAEREAAAQRQVEEQAAKARAQQEAAARQQAQARAQAPQAQAAAMAPSAPVEYRRGVAVRSMASGQGLFTVTLPATWNLEDAVLLKGASSSRPYNAYARFSDGADAGMTLTLGDAGVRNSAGMDAMMAQYGGAIASVDRVHYAPMPVPRPTADNHAFKTIREFGGANVSRIREFGGLDLGRRQQHARETFERAARATGPAILRDPFAAEIIRLYAFTIGEAAYRMAVYARIYAIKDGSGVDMLNPAGLVFNLGSALGSRISKKKAAASNPNAVSGADNIAESDGKPLSAPAYSSYVDGGTIYWDVCGLATVFAPVDRFDRAYSEAFLPLIRDYWLHNDILALATADSRQQAAAVQQATNVQIRKMNMQHQAAMAAARQAQAAADARFEAWQRDSDAHHAAFRERTNADFRDSGTGGGVGDWSEAIRGVNTFVTSDGREVELDVAADRAYENQAGDVIGGSGGFDPGADWTEIPRR